MTKPEKNRTENDRLAAEAGDLDFGTDLPPFENLRQPLKNNHRLLR